MPKSLSYNHCEFYRNYVKVNRMILLPDEYWEIRNTQKKGRGMFAKRDILKGRVIGDYLGLVVRPEDALIDEGNFYLMYYHDHAAIFPNLKEPGVYLLNHSCNPNAFLYTYKGHTLTFALKKIPKGDEMTIPYLLSPKDRYCNPCLHKCNCDYLNCSKSMHLPNEQYVKWRKFNKIWAKKTKRERVSVGKDLPKLLSYPKTISSNYIKEVKKIFNNYN
jgi:SET domain-containing protein